MNRGESASIVALLAAALLTGCTPADPAPDKGKSPTPSATPTPTPTPTQAKPDPEAIRDVDFGELEWTWDTLGQQYPVKLVAGRADVLDPEYEQTGHFSVGDPVFSDADGDGALDAAVPLTWELSNGIQTTWFVWLAQPEQPDAPQQIPFPIASGARCGDMVSGVTAIDGGFRVDEVMRSSAETSAECAAAGTMRRSREVVVVGDGTGAGSWPATKDGMGWGGYCPVKVYTEGERAEAQGRLGPSEAAPKTSATGEKLYTPLQPYPFRQPEGWRLTGFLPDVEVDDSVVCVWLPEQ